MQTAAKNHPTDEIILSWIADWQAARAEAALEHARINKATLFGHRDEPFRVGAVDSSLSKMKDLENHIVISPPHTLRGAVATLDMVLDILAARAIDPHLRISKGPVLELVRNVRNQLEFADQETPIGGSEG